MSGTMHGIPGMSGSMHSLPRMTGVGMGSLASGYVAQTPSAAANAALEAALSGTALGAGVGGVGLGGQVGGSCNAPMRLSSKTVLQYTIWMPLQ